MKNKKIIEKLNLTSFLKSNEFNELSEKEIRLRISEHLFDMLSTKLNRMVITFEITKYKLIMCTNDDYNLNKMLIDNDEFKQSLLKYGINDYEVKPLINGFNMVNNCKII